MFSTVIKDKRGKVPNWVLDGNVLLHQPSGKETEVASYEREDLIEGKARIRQRLVAEQC